MPLSTTFTNPNTVSARDHALPNPFSPLASHVQIDFFYSPFYAPELTSTINVELLISNFKFGLLTSFYYVPLL